VHLFAIDNYEQWKSRVEHSAGSSGFVSKSVGAIGDLDESQMGGRLKASGTPVVHRWSYQETLEHRGKVECISWNSTGVYTGHEDRRLTM
jgi:hypothetical protein